jgi:hypothetical protein
LVETIEKLLMQNTSNTPNTSTSTSRIANLPIDELENHGFQSRAAISKEVVNDYAAHMAGDGPPLPPIVVFECQYGYYLADGFHRVEAAKQAGLDTISVDIRMGDHDAAKWYSIGANQSHGLRRSAADKRNATKMALEMQPDMSDRAIATYVGVSHTTVASVRSGGHMATSNETRTGLDGKKYPIPPVPEEPSDPGGQLSTSDSSPPVRSYPPERPDSAQEPSPHDHSEVLDNINRRIPYGVLPMWEQAEETREVLKFLGKLKSTLKKAENSKDVNYVELNFGQLIPMVGNFSDMIKRAIPFTICPNCQAQQHDRCNFCQGKGMISKHKWDVAVSEELKEIAKVAG